MSDDALEVSTLEILIQQFRQDIDRQLTEAVLHAILNTHSAQPGPVCFLTEGIVVAVFLAMERITGTKAEAGLAALVARLPERLAEVRSRERMH